MFGFFLCFLGGGTYGSVGRKQGSLAILGEVLAPPAEKQASGCLPKALHIRMQCLLLSILPGKQLLNLWERRTSSRSSMRIKS